MTKYTVIYETLIVAGYAVDADTPTAAIARADTEGIPGLCHQCTGPTYGDWWRDDPDEWTPVAVHDTNGNDVWTDCGLVKRDHASALRSAARDLSASNNLILSGVAEWLRRRADDIEEIGESSAKTRTDDEG